MGEQRHQTQDFKRRRVDNLTFQCYSKHIIFRGAGSILTQPLIEKESVNMEREKEVDESWKEAVAKEKEVPSPEAVPESEEYLGEVNFANYVTSLAFQTLIFLGEMANPLTQKTEQNLPQAKFLIDTLIMLRDKTKGNLSQEEGDLLNASIYELQMKYVEKVPKETPK